MFTERIKTHHSAMAEGKKYLAGMKAVADVLTVENTDKERPAVIYVHVPFCKKICSFCNMRRSLKNPEENYANWIVDEIKAYGALPYIQTTVFDAVYFGGGTPTTLSGEELSLILRTLKEELHFTEDAEFSIETTVTELTSEKLKMLVDAGANRFSVGVQTFDDAGRKLMGRVGSGGAAYQKLKEIKSYEDVTVSMDLIYNYPQQTMESLYADLDQILSLDLNGFSMYSLIDMKTTSIDKAQDDANDARMFYAIADHMKPQGYHFLELTKMVKNDGYKYIMNRHAGADTLPLGAGAGGSIGGLALMNPIELDQYRDSVYALFQRKGMYFQPEYKEIVCFKGAVQTGFLPEDEKVYKDTNEYKSFLEKLLKHQYVVWEQNRYRLTDKGIYWGNTISRQLSEMAVYS